MSSFLFILHNFTNSRHSFNPSSGAIPNLPDAVILQYSFSCRGDANHKIVFVATP